MRRPQFGFALGAPNAPHTIATPAKPFGRFAFPPFALPLAIGVFLIAGWGENWSLGIAAIVVFLVGCSLLWRPGEPPIFLYIFGIQWLQISSGVFRANWYGDPIDGFSHFSLSIGLATWLSLAGLACLAFGMRLGAGPQLPETGHNYRMAIVNQPWMRWFWLYVGAVGVATLAQSLALVVPGLSQPLLAVASFKWAAFFAFTYATLVHPNSSRTIWLCVFFVELVLSLGGYFSSFRAVFGYSLLAVVAAGVRLSRARLVVLLALVLATLLISVIWTAVKNDYRDYVNQGTGQQVVAVGYGDRLGKLLSLTLQLDKIDLTIAADNLVRRISYTEYFGAALEYVPHVVPHQHGALWVDAITRPFMPRLFFPDKTIIDESELTNRFTGLEVGSMAQGTQIGLGYMAESYVDFGKVGMPIAIFAYGLFLGLLYRSLTSNRVSPSVIGSNLAVAVLYQADAYAASSAKLVGGIVVSALVAWILIALGGRRFAEWLSTTSARIDTRV